MLMCAVRWRKADDACGKLERVVDKLACALLLIMPMWSAKGTVSVTSDASMREP